METILIVDVNPERADLICEMLHDNEVEARRCRSIHETKEVVNSANCPAVVVAHCELINSSFTELALLRHHKNIKLLFYCTDGSEQPSNVMKLPEELAEIITRITENQRHLQRAI